MTTIFLKNLNNYTVKFCKKDNDIKVLILKDSIIQDFHVKS